MSSSEAWLAVEKLFRIFDKDRDGQLNLDELVSFVAQAKKVGRWFSSGDESFVT